MALSSSGLRPVAWALALALAPALACSDEAGDSGRSVLEAAPSPGEASVRHLGRVHLLLQPQPDELEPEPELQISGRFVEYRGAAEDFVRARTNLPVPAWERLVPGQCVASTALEPDPGSPAQIEDGRELLLVDAGDLRVFLGGREFVAPLALVPDILPWLSGVEYLHVDDRIPTLAVGPDGTAPVRVSIDGTADGGLDGFAAALVVPASLALEAARLDAQRLTIDWRPPGSAERSVVLRLQAFAEDDGASTPVGEEVSCLVTDAGRADLALGPLAEAGLAVDAGLLRVTASRYDSTRVEAGAFGEVELIVELRSQAILPLD